MSQVGPEVPAAGEQPAVPTPTGVAATVLLVGPPDGAAPIEFGRTVTVYVCGITPYDAAHVGHAFTYVSFDTLIRFLRARGHEVRYCQNVTDVDDDVLRRPAATAERDPAIGVIRGDDLVRGPESHPFQP